MPLNAMSRLYINTCSEKEDFVKWSARLRREISRSQMNVADDDTKMKEGDAALILTTAITTVVIDGLKYRKNKNSPPNLSSSSTNSNPVSTTNSSPSNSNCEWLHGKLKNLMERWKKQPLKNQRVAKTALLASSACAIATAFLCISERKSPQETIKYMVRNGILSGLSSGILSLITDFAVLHWEAIKNCIFGVASEMTEQTTIQFCTVGVGAIVSSCFEILLWIGHGFLYGGKGSSISEILKNFFWFLCDTVTTNLMSAGIGIFSGFKTYQ